MQGQEAGQISLTRLRRTQIETTRFHRVVSWMASTGSDGFRLGFYDGSSASYFDHRRFMRLAVPRVTSRIAPSFTYWGDAGSADVSPRGCR
jgi:hypothetical protein